MPFTSRVCIALVSVLFFASCEDYHNEVFEEPITSMFFVLTPDSGQIIVLSHIDNDGIGGQPALVSSGKLKANTIYQCQLKTGVRNPISTLRIEHMIDSTSVEAEPEMHQVFFTPMNGLQLNVTYADTDGNGFPIGMQSVLRTGDISDGELAISIVHSPNKSGANVRNGDRLLAGGTIDLEVIFELQITSE